MADEPPKAQIYQAAKPHYFGNALRTTRSTLVLSARGIGFSEDDANRRRRKMDFPEHCARRKLGGYAASILATR